MFATVISGNRFSRVTSHRSLVTNSLLISLLEEAQQTIFIEINRAVVDQSPNRGCQLGKVWKLFSRKAQRSQALRYPHFRGEPFDEDRSLTRRLRLGFGMKAGVQAACDKCHLFDARGEDASHHGGQ